MFRLFELIALALSMILAVGGAYAICSCPEKCTQKPRFVDASGDERRFACSADRDVQLKRDGFSLSSEAVMEAVPPDVQATRTISGLVLLSGPPGFRQEIQIFGIDPFTERLRDTEPDFHYTLLGSPNRGAPDDDYFGNQWSLNRVRRPRCSENAHINVAAAWRSLPPEVPIGDPDAIIGFVDNGISWHEDLVANLWVNEKEGNGVAGKDDDGNKYKDDIHGIDAQSEVGLQEGNLKDGRDQKHGTQVASIAGARGDNTHMIAGVSWNARLLPCRFHGSAAELVSCLRYFKALKLRGENIVAVNLSLGGPGCSCCVERELRELRDLGVLIVAAAGNEGDDNDLVECATYPGSQRVSNIISVAATTCTDDLDHDNVLGLDKQSNRGRRTVHVAAPGHRIPSIVAPDIATYGEIGLTSAATPHVTGMVPLLLAQDSTRDWVALRNLLIAGGTPNLPGLKHMTISGRRLRAWDDCATGSASCTGSMSCVNQSLCRRLVPTQDRRMISLDDPLDIVVMKIDCATPGTEEAIVVEGPASTTSGPTPTPLILSDKGPVIDANGTPAPDDYAGDGELTARWKPKEPGKYRLKMCGDDGETLTVEVSP